MQETKPTSSIDDDLDTKIDYKTPVFDVVSDITNKYLGALADPNSVLHDIIANRLSMMKPEDRLGIVPALLTDPSKSGVVVERYRLQSGATPTDEITDDIDQMVVLWAAEKMSIPKLECPRQLEPALMELARELGLMGGGPFMFSREEAEQIMITKNTLLHINGAANRANIERIRTALALLNAHGNPNVPIIATANPLRILKDAELEKVKEFAPTAQNEFELMVDSAINEGFTLDASNLRGSKILPNGASYINMTHASVGAKLTVLCPKQESGKTGVYNAYATLNKFGSSIIGDDFTLDNSDVVHVNSTHYAATGSINSLSAVCELGVSLQSFQTIGDNQPSRNAQAHLIEIGIALNLLAELIDNSSFRDILIK